MAGGSVHDLYSARLTTAGEAVAPIAAGEYVSCAMAIGQPPALLAALADRLRRGDLSGIRLYYKFALDHLATTLLADDVVEKVDPHTMFIHGRDQELIQRQIRTGRKVVSYVPVHFSHVPRVFEETIELDTFLVTVSPMDRGGYFSFGTNNDYTSVAARRAKRLIVEVNRNMPRVFGQSLLHVSEVSAIIENDLPLIELGASEPSEEGKLIGEIVAPMIPDGATIQLGIGKLLTGVAQSLSGHTDLGLHSELFTPAIAGLVQQGVLTGRRKNLHQHKHVFTFAVGTAQTYEFMNDNASFESHPSSYVNDVRVIAGNDNLVSVNTAIEIDLYGQVNAEFIAGHEFSGTGGQFDFVKGASLARNGRSIIALPSTARKGAVSSIVPKVGMVTDIRADVEWVVTEFGAVNLRGRSTKERAEALISIAHPDFRAELIAAAHQITLI